MCFIRWVGGRGLGWTCCPKKVRFSCRFSSALCGDIFPGIRGDFSPRFGGLSPRDLRGFPPAIRGDCSPRFSGIVTSDLRGFSSAILWDFPLRFTGLRFYRGNDKMRLPLWCASCDEHDSKCYSDPPRRPDDVLDPLRPPPACRVEGHFCCAGTYTNEDKVCRTYTNEDKVCTFELDWLGPLASVAHLG